MLDFIKPYIPEIVTFIAGASAWGYERNKRKADLKKADTENNKSIMDLYQEALDDLKKRYDEKFSDLEAEISVLRQNLKDSELRYDKLKQEFTNYKKNHK
jgi:chaperonin cofactor prefoldin